jgi:ABC-2 type transport system permease protein
MLMLLMFGYALTLDVDRVPFVVWDQSHTPESRDFVARFTATRYFDFRGTVSRYADLEHAIDTRNAALGLVLPPEFAAHLAAGRSAGVQAIVDGSDSNTAGIILGYTQAIATGLQPAARARPDPARHGHDTGPGARSAHAGLVQPRSRQPQFHRAGHHGGDHGPDRGAAHLADDRPRVGARHDGAAHLHAGETGRAHPRQIAALLRHRHGQHGHRRAHGRVLFDVPLRGSVTLLFSVGAVFIVGTLAQGILISALARQQLLASQMAMISTFLPAFLLSGFAFAIANMPVPVQAVTFIVPARYFVALVKGIFLRGVGLERSGPMPFSSSCSRSWSSGSRSA